MNRRWLNGALLAGWLVTLGLLWVRGNDPTQPNFEFLPEMVHSVAYDAFAPNPNFPDGKTLQEPVPRTIPQGYLPLRHETPPTEDADPEAAARGAAVYNTFCAPCHGLSGRGDGPVALRGYPAPSSIVQGRSISMSDGQLFFIVGAGWRRMPSYATQITREDRWKLIQHLRFLQSQEADRNAPPVAEQPAGSPTEREGEGQP